MKTKIFITSLLSLISSALYAQAASTGYFTDGYIYRHALNPAMGNDQNYISLPGLGSINVTVMGNISYENIIRDNPLYPTKSNKSKTTFLNPYITNPLKDFSKGGNKINTMGDIAIMSAGWKGFGGYNTLEINTRSTSSINIPYELLKMAVELGNDHYDIGHIGASATGYAEIALGHSHNINEKLRIGGKLKLLVGFVNAKLEMRNATADLTGEDEWRINGDAQANVSLKGFRFESETESLKSSNGTYQRVSGAEVDKPGIGGIGAAVDLGAVYKINNDFQASIALKDFGFINWNNNVQASNIQKSFIFKGFHDIDVNEDENGSLSNQADSYGDQLAQFLNLTDQGDQGSKSAMLGATLNIGAEYTLPVYRKVTFGALSTTRIQGRYSWTEARISTNYAPAKWFSTGVSAVVGTHASSVGWIVNIHPRAFNFFLAMDRIVGNLSKDYIPHRSNASLTFGMNITW